MCVLIDGDGDGEGDVDGEDDIPRKRTSRSRSSKRPSPYGYVMQNHIISCAKRLCGHFPHSLANAWVVPEGGLCPAVLLKVYCSFLNDNYGGLCFEMT